MYRLQWSRDLKMCPYLISEVGMYSHTKNFSFSSKGLLPLLMDCYWHQTWLLVVWTSPVYNMSYTIMWVGLGE